MIYKIFSQSSFKNKTINSSRHVNQKSSKQVFILLFEGSNKRRACPQMIEMYQWKIPWRTKVRKKVTHAITFHGIKFHHCYIIVFWQILQILWMKACERLDSWVVTTWQKLNFPVTTISKTFCYTRNIVFNTQQ